MSSPAPLTSPNTIYGRGLLTFTLVWQLAWLAFDPRLWPNNQSNPLEAAFVAGAMITVLLLGADVIFVRESSLRRRVLIWCNLVMLTASALTMLLDGDRFTDGWVAGSTFVILATGVAALVLPLEVAAVYIVVIAIVEGLLLSFVHGLGVVDSVLYPMYALAVGAGMASASLSLRRVAQRVEAGTTRAAEALRASELERSLREAAEESDRAIHDVVLNTLTAVSRGGLADRVVGLRARCAEAAALLRRLMTDQGGASEVEVHRAHIFELTTRLEAAGVVVDLPADAVLPVPIAVRVASLAAAAEALRNVEMHAGASAVTVRYEADDEYLVGVIEDDGIGFDAESVAGFGITHSIKGAMENIGGSAEIVSTPGAGTRVILRWKSAESAGSQQFADALADAFAIFVPSIAIGFGALTVLSAVLTLRDFATPALTLVDLVAYLALSGFVIWRSLARPGLSWTASVFAILAAIVVYRVQVFLAPTTGATAWTDWGSEAVVAIFIIVIVAGPKWVWPVSIAGWVLAQGGDPLELLRPGTGVLIAATLLSFTLRRQYAEYDELLTEVTRVDVERFASAEAARIRRERYGRLVETPVLQLLDGIAAGTLDPNEESVREACRIEERFVRTMMRLDPSSDAIHALVAALALDARLAGRQLDVGVYGEYDVEPRSIERPLRVFREVIRSTPGEHARITASQEDAQVVVRLVAEVPPEMSPLMSPTTGVGDASFVFTRDPEGSDGLWEVYVANAVSGERRSSTRDR